MSLDKYHAKRNFSLTPEQRGEVENVGASLRYFIQRHDASKLHFDFRLELNGTLKSWAIPKGPSLSPAEKRLAVHVEDHPIAYGTFEGTIPARQYGAGDVVLWDHGIWIPDGDPNEGYKSGNLKFHLEGEKLTGGWVLVRLRDTRNDKENWLLIKHKDASARTGDQAEITHLLPGSVKATVRKVGKPKKTVAGKSLSSSSQASVDTTGAEACEMPQSVAPQLATLAEVAPSGSGWLAEVKFDGYRGLCRIAQGEVKLFTRNGNDWTKKWPAIAQAASKLSVDEAWIDGEVVATDDKGQVSFQALQNQVQDGAKAQLAYYAFDLLYMNGFDLTGMALIERKKLLQELIANLGSSVCIYYSDHVSSNIAELFEQACHHRLEGLVIKQANSRYSSGRSTTWRKLKCIKRQEFVVCGYTKALNSRLEFGALLLGAYDGHALKYIGKVGTGFDTKTLSALAKKFIPLRVAKSALSAPPSGASVRGVHWLRPEMVAEVQFAEFTEGGLLRHASFIAMREDKPASEVTLEPHPVAVTEKTADSAQSVDTVAGIKLTHPSRMLFPAANIDKLGLALYYEKIATWILPHLAGRPLSLLRCPTVAGQDCFFQKHATDATSLSISRIDIKNGAETSPYMIINDLAALISVVQMGVVELHTWGAKAGKLSKPDRLVFDLDPAPDVPWQHVIDGALLIRGLLEQIGLVSFVKTTGGKGLHVVAPIAPDHDWDIIKQFSRSVAEHLANIMPERFTAKMSKATRTGKIFIDYLRNSEGATTVAAFSTRANPAGTVSVPIEWEELNSRLRQHPFTVQDVPQHLEAIEADPWASYFSSKQHLSAKMITLFN